MILFQQDLWQLLREYARKESSRLPHQFLQSQNEMNGLLICSIAQFQTRSGTGDEANGSDRLPGPGVQSRESAFCNRRDVVCRNPTNYTLSRVLV